MSYPLPSSCLHLHLPCSEKYHTHQFPCGDWWHHPHPSPSSLSWKLATGLLPFPLSILSGESELLHSTNICLFLSIPLYYPGLVPYLLVMVTASAVTSAPTPHRSRMIFLIMSLPWKIRSKHLRWSALTTTSQTCFSFPSPASTPCSRFFPWSGTLYLLFLQLILAVL